MYVPPHFVQDDRSRLFECVERYPFAVLVSNAGERPFATHLPLLLDRDAGPNGTLVGHMARDNPHWRLARGETLAIFSGPHSYISPTWYEAERVVPTWNYVAVHAYGKLTILDSHGDRLRIVRDFVERFERGMPRPWRLDASEGVSDAPPVESGARWIERLAESIVGFRIEIERLEGKWKLNQNQPRDRRERVARALEAGEDDQSRGVASLMRQNLEDMP